MEKEKTSTVMGCHTQPEKDWEDKKATVSEDQCTATE